MHREMKMNLLFLILGFMLGFLMGGFYIYSSNTYFNLTQPAASQIKQMLGKEAEHEDRT